MKHLHEREVARMLRRVPRPRPPARLAQRIKDEIPERIVVGEGALRHGGDREHAVAYRQLVVLGAVLFLAVVVALWGMRVIQAERERAARQDELERLLVAGEASPVGPPGWIDAVRQPGLALPLRVDTASFQGARSLLAAGRLPPPETVSAAAFVSAFDYGDPAPLRGDLAIYAEGAAIPGAPARRLVRVAVRAAGAPPVAHGDVPPPIARGATARLSVNPAVVARYRVVGDAAAPPLRIEARPTDLLPGHRVTLLLEIEPQPDAPADGTALEISISWRRRAGAAATVTHTLLASEIGGPWSSAPPSLRLAAVAAELAGALSRRPGPDPVAVAAVQHEAAALAAGYPADPGIAELAHVVRRLPASR